MRSFVLIILVQCIKHILAVWQVSNNDLTFDDTMSGGVYNNSIYLIGGYDDKRGFKEYEWTTQIFYDTDQLDTDIYGQGQYWSQQQHTVYIIVPQTDGTQNHLATYNMQTNAFISNLISIPSAVQWYGCLASNGEYIYVVGGWNGLTLNEVQILNVSTLQWVTDGPVMKEKRDSASCIVSNDYLWVFGGYDAPNPLQTNERVHITNIMQNAWIYVDSLSNPVYNTRCVSWDDIIYIIGGWDRKDVYNTVDKINTATGVIISTDYMPYASYLSTPIIANAVLYVFGGLSDLGTGSLINKWIYFSLPTGNPSSLPTDAPTTIPTALPSTIPTGLPSKTPTAVHVPTTYPTATNEPTTNTTNVAILISTTYNPSTDDTDPSRTQRDGEVFEPYTSSISLTAAHIETPYKVDSVWLVIMVVIAAVTAALVIWLLRRCHDHSKRKKEVEDNMNNMAANKPNIDEIEEVYTVKGPQQSNHKDDVVIMDNLRKIVSKEKHVVNNIVAKSQQVDNAVAKRKSVSNSEDIYNDNLINNELKWTQGTTGGTNTLQERMDDDNRIDNERVWTVEGEDDHVLCQLCVDCGKQDFGKVYSDDGLFYCNSCWMLYEGQKTTVTNATKTR